MKIFEVRSTDFLEDKRLINNALADMASQFRMQNDFTFGEPVSRFGWTFFKLWIKPHLQDAIVQKFNDMIRKSKGANLDEQFTSFHVGLFPVKGM